MLAIAGCGSTSVDGISAGGAGGVDIDGGRLDSSAGGTGGAAGTAGGGGSGGAGGSAPCTSDNGACTSGAQCCSQSCNASGGCAPLNPECRTTGNACTSHGDCCSKLCSGGVCTNGSFCTLNGDVCAANTECCGGLCNKTQGAPLGTCSQPNPGGASGCAIAGQACGGSMIIDGGGVNDAGVPSCGGECCSRACAPHRSGLLVCQPPSGCRPTGEICASDIDCCGFDGIKGQTGNGFCNKTNATDPVGRCSNANSCNPAGSVCKLATMTCNAENNCCSGNVNQNPFVCQQDILGIPRCTMAGQPCTDAGSKAGQACASSADCCGLTCVPNPGYTPDGGLPPFVCGGKCVGSGGTCSTSADCCPGLPCTLPPGSTRGVCGSPPSGDGGGTVDARPPADVDIPDVPTDAPKPPCAEYGQVCSSNGDCCNGVPCNDGRCVYIVK